MYVFSGYKNCLLFALEAQLELQKADWPEELNEYLQTSAVRGIPVRMGMHSGPLKRIRIRVKVWLITMERVQTVRHELCQSQ